MLEHYTSQAAGLLGMGSQSRPRLMAMVSHGDEQAELPLLWRLCLALVNSGHAVTVLDANTRESDSNPGLEQLLDDTDWRDEKRDTPAWAVIPSSKGVQSLCAVPAAKLQNMHRLGHLFADDGVVILYCKVDWMIPLIGGSGVAPLLAVSPVRASLLTSYMALKRLLITGELKPTIVNMIQEERPTLPHATPAVSGSLGECARRFLGQDIHVIDIREQRGEDPLYGEVQRLALRLLEGSVSLNVGDPAATAPGRVTHSGHADRFAGSH